MSGEGGEGRGPVHPDEPGHDVLALAVGTCALLLLCLSPWLVDRSGPDPFYKGPLIFPAIVLALTVVGSLPAVVRLLRMRPRRALHVDGAGFPRRGAALFLLMCLYPAAISAVGLEAASFAALLAGLMLTGRGLLQSVLIAAALTTLLYLAFRLFLDIWFPAPWLPEMAGF